MISQIFKTGGGAGIGSFVLVLKDGALLNVSAEKVRWSYDSGENLYLSIIDDSTEEALLPLSGYVDNEGVLHLSGRDFDDNKTYEIAVGDENQSIELNTVDGVTMGEGTIASTSDLPSNYVTTDTEQIVTGPKSFTSQSVLPGVTINYENRISGDGIDLMSDASDGNMSTCAITAYHIGLANSDSSLNINVGNDQHVHFEVDGQEGPYDLILPEKNGTIATTDDCTKLYRHHFDIILAHDDVAAIPEGSTVAINVNALSNSGTPWQTLSELDGGGYIVSAFGNIPNVYDYVFELKLYYNSLGVLLLNIHDLVDNTVKAFTANTVGGGQIPSTFPLQDSVTEL